MKEIVVYIHISQNAENTSHNKWLPEFKEQLSNALLRYDIKTDLYTNDKDEFYSKIGIKTFGLYLPIINKDFLNSSKDVSLFNNIKDQIENNYYQKAFHVSVIESVLPINYAQYQPVFKFFNQGRYQHEPATRKVSEYLPGNNTRMSFQENIHGLAKEISDQLFLTTSLSSKSPKVFIGASTSDLDEPLKSLYNFLINQGIEVITPILNSNLGKSFLQKKIMEAMKQCWLCIHPFGNGPIDKKYVLDDSSNLCELEANISSNYYAVNKHDQYNEVNFRRIIWTPKVASPSTYEGRMIDRIKNHAIHNNDAELIDCSLDELKRIIIAYKSSSTNSGAELYSSSNAPENTYLADENKNDLESVFVMYEGPYEYVLDELSSILSQQDLKMITRKDLEKEENFSLAKTTALTKCKGVIILCSNWNTNWFNSNVHEVLKVKANRQTQKYDFLCVMSREISQLPHSIEKDFVLIPINGNIDANIINTVLLNKRTLIE